MAGKYSINRDKVLLPVYLSQYSLLHMIWSMELGHGDCSMVIVACLVEETLESTIDKPILKLLV